MTNNKSNIKANTNTPKNDNNKKPASKSIPSFNSLSDLKRFNTNSPKRSKNKKGGKSNPKSNKKAGSLVTKLEHKAAQALVDGDVPKAKKLYDDYIALNPANAAAYSNRGIANAKLGDINSSVNDFKQAVALNPDYTAAYSNLANAYLNTKQFELAHDAIKHALRLDANNYNANFNYFIILSKLKRYEDAIKAIDTLFNKFPEHIKQVDPSPFIDIKKQVCDWRDTEALEARVVPLIDAGKFEAKWALVHVNNHALNGEQQRTVLEKYAKQNFGYLSRQPLAPYSRVNTENSRRIRIAYVSSDFQDHATTRLMAELFESHDRTKFEWYAISHSINDNSAMRARIIKSFEHFIEVGDWTDAQISQWMREQEIDIAIDLKGHTDSNRLGIFARGCAPVQMTYIGFPGTTGSDFMDYIIGDKWVTPMDAQAQFSETICQLPHCYQPNDRQRYLPKQASMTVYPNVDPEYKQWRDDRRVQEGLPIDATVLCCFNNSYKLHPSVFTVWMAVLANHPKAVLWLLADKLLTETNLRKQAVAHGIDENRIYFAPRTKLNAYLERYLLANLFVDTLAYNAHTTGSDALWIGLPLVTLAGNSFASRVGASLLDTVGLPELITYSLTEYAKKIDDLCTHPDKLREYSQKLRNNRAQSPLFDAVQIARDLENLYLSVVDKPQAAP